MIRESKSKQKKSARTTKKTATKPIRCSDVTIGHLVALANEHDVQATIQQEWKEKAAKLHQDVVSLNTEIREGSKKLNPKRPSAKNEAALSAKAKTHDRQAIKLKDATDRKNAAKEGRKSAVAALLETIRGLGRNELLFDQNSAKPDAAATEKK